MNTPQGSPAPVNGHIRRHESPSLARVSSSYQATDSATRDPESTGPLVSAPPVETGFMNLVGESVHARAMMLFLPTVLSAPELLRDLLGKVTAKSHSRQRARSMARRSTLAKRLTAGELEAVEALAEEVVTSARRAAGTGWKANLQSLRADAQMRTDPVAALLKQVPLHTLANMAAISSSPILTDSRCSYYFLTYLSYRHAVDGAEHRQVPLRAIYVAAVGSMESLLTLLLQRAFMAGAGTPFTTVHSAHEAASKALAHGPGNWRDALTDVLQSKSAATAIDWSAVQRAWAHRNILVHRGGVVDERFRKIVPNGPDIGQVLILQRSDVERVIHLALTTRLAMFLCALDAVVPNGGQQLAGYMEMLSYQYLADGRPKVAEAICDLSLPFVTQRATSARLKVARWIAMRDQGTLVEDRAQVARWRTSGLPGEFRVAQLIFLNRYPEALQLLDILVERGLVEADALATWELFRPIRERRGTANESG